MRDSEGKPSGRIPQPSECLRRYVMTLDPRVGEAQKEQQKKREEKLAIAEVLRLEKLQRHAESVAADLEAKSAEELHEEEMRFQEHEALYEALMEQQSEGRRKGRGRRGKGKENDTQSRSQYDRG